MRAKAFMPQLTFGINIVDVATWRAKEIYAIPQTKKNVYAFNICKPQTTLFAFISP